MKIIKSIIVSFSIYSKIPMPLFRWEEENMKHAITFLPLIGVVIGIISFLAMKLFTFLGLPVFFTTIILSIIPVLITGGFHLDGFMDVQDALHSYQDKGKKLEIMKDPHIGAFAVISIGTYMLSYIAFLYLIVYKISDNKNMVPIAIYSLIFCLARACCAATSIALPNAKKDGMLSMETKKAGKTDIVLIALQGGFAAIVMLILNVLLGIIVIAALGLVTFWYSRTCEKEFGGVTGDTAGFFITAAEGVLVAVLAVGTFLFI